MLMLILTRKAGESLRIGDDVHIVVVRISSRRVKLGIEAPANVEVLRGELEKKPARAVHEGRSR
jgi:carbon storage regulator